MGRRRSSSTDSMLSNINVALSPSYYDAPADASATDQPHTSNLPPEKPTMSSSTTQAGPASSAAEGPSAPQLPRPRNVVTHSAGKLTDAYRRMIRSLRENMYTPVTSIIRRYDRLTVTFLTQPGNTTMPPLDVHAAAIDGANPAIAVPRLLASRLAQLGVLLDEAAAAQRVLERRQGERAREGLLLGALRGGYIEIEGSEGRAGEDDVRVRRGREDEDGSVAFDFLEPRQEDDEEEEDDEEAAQREIDRRMRLAGLKPGAAEVEEHFEQDEWATDEEAEGQSAGAESDEEWAG